MSHTPFVQDWYGDFGVFRSLICREERRGEVVGGGQVYVGL